MSRVTVPVFALIPLPRKQAGLALVAVLWIVAALTLTVMGAVYAVRTEVGAASRLRETVVGGALSDAAIVLTAREMSAPKVAATGPMRHYDATIEGQTIGVGIIALSGLIDLNAAGENLLAAMFTIAGGVDPDSAAVLAQRVLDWRDPDDSARPKGAETAAYVAANSPFRPRNGPFEAPEDLLQVLGVDFQLYDKVKNLVTVNMTRGSGQVDPYFAPMGVLRVLAGANPQVASDYNGARPRDGLMADTTRFPTEFVAARQVSSRYLMVASVNLSTGGKLVTRKVVDMDLKQDGRPWTVISSDRNVESADSN
jgi:general secretion pathway protein K